MKLADLTLPTAAAKAATAKLANQTSMVYVPAGKAPYTDLSIVGVKLRHKQSSGITSRINEGKASAQDLMRAAAEDLGYGKELPQGAQDVDEAYAQAVAIGRLYDAHDSKEANRIADLINILMVDAKNATSSSANFLATSNHCVGAFKRVAEGMYQVHNELGHAEDQYEWLKDILDFIDFLTGEMAYSEDKYHRQIAKAVCKQLGFKTT